MAQFTHEMFLGPAINVAVLAVLIQPQRCTSWQSVQCGYSVDGSRTLESYVPVMFGTRVPVECADVHPFSVDYSVDGKPFEMRCSHSGSYVPFEV